MSSFQELLDLLLVQYSAAVSDRDARLRELRNHFIKMILDALTALLLLFPGDPNLIAAKAAFDAFVAGLVPPYP